jgi:mono/diheme cytochrome c family protein
MDKSHGWYGYELDTANSYLLAATIKSPLAPTEVHLNNGKTLYTKFCVQCHGEKGDGQGKIVQNGKIEGIPAYNTLDISEGQMFYSITYGKGLMGAHASFMSPKERWQLVMYVNALRNGGQYPDPNAVDGEAENETATDSTTVVNEQVN